MSRAPRNPLPPPPPDPAATQAAIDTFVAYLAAHLPTINGIPFSPTGTPLQSAAAQAANAQNATTFGGLATAYPRSPAVAPTVVNNYYGAAGPAPGALSAGPSQWAAYTPPYRPPPPPPSYGYAGDGPASRLPPRVDPYSPLPSLDHLLTGERLRAHRAQREADPSAYDLPALAAGGSGGRPPPRAGIASGAADFGGSSGGEDPWARLSASARAAAEGLGRLGSATSAYAEMLGSARRAAINWDGGGGGGDDGGGAGGGWPMLPGGGGGGGGGGGPLARYTPPDRLRIPNGVSPATYGRMLAAGAIARTATGFLQQQNAYDIGLAGGTSSDDVVQAQLKYADSSPVGSIPIVGALGSAVNEIDGGVGLTSLGENAYDLFKGRRLRGFSNRSDLASAQADMAIGKQTEGIVVGNRLERLGGQQGIDRARGDYGSQVDELNLGSQAAVLRSRADTSGRVTDIDSGIAAIRDARWFGTTRSDDGKISALSGQASALQQGQRDYESTQAMLLKAQVERLTIEQRQSRLAMFDAADLSNFAAGGASEPAVDRLALINSQSEAEAAARERMAVDPRTGRRRDPLGYRPGVDPATGRRYAHAFDPATGRFDQSAADYEALAGQQAADRRLLDFRQATTQDQRNIAAGTEVDVTTAAGTGSTLVGSRAAIRGRYQLAVANPLLTAQDRMNALDVRNAQDAALTTETQRGIGRSNAMGASLDLANRGDTLAAGLAQLRATLGVSGFDRAGRPNFFGLDPAEAKTAQDRGLIQRQVDAQRGLYAGELGSLRRSQWQLEYRSRGEVTAADDTIRGDGLGASMARIDAGFQAATTDDRGRPIDPTTLDYVRADRDRGAQSRLARFDDQQRRFGTSLSTRGLFQQAGQQDLRTRHLDRTADVQSLIDAGSNDIEAANVEYRGPENADLRRSRIAGIEASHLSSIRGVTDSVLNRGEGAEVGAFTFFGNRNNHAFDDFRQAQDRGATAGRAFKTAERTDPFSLPGVRTPQNLLGYDPSAALGAVGGLFGFGRTSPPGTATAQQLAGLSAGSIREAAKPDAKAAASNPPTADQLQQVLAAVNQLVSLYGDPR